MDVRVHYVHGSPSAPKQCQRSDPCDHVAFGQALALEDCGVGQAGAKDAQLLQCQPSYFLSLKSSLRWNPSAQLKALSISFCVILLDG